MDILSEEKKSEKPLKTPREAFHSSEKVVKKLMQPLQKTHVYSEDTLVESLSLSLDLIAEIDSELKDLVEMSNYPNFKHKCAEFSSLCEDIKGIINLSLDNLEHFSSFDRLDDLKEQRDRAEVVISSLTTFCECLDHTSEETDKLDYAPEFDDHEILMSEHVNIDHAELEEAKQQGMFEDLSIDSEELKEPVDAKDTDLVPTKTQITLNQLIMMRIENIKKLAQQRNPLKGSLYQQRVKDVREGKFEICVPAVGLAFKYLAELFKIIKRTIKEAIERKQEGSYKTFIIYASKFTQISEMLFSSLYAKNDMLYKDFSDESWEKFFSVYDCYEPKDIAEFNRQYRNLCNFQALSAAFISKAGNHSNAFWEFLGQAKYAAYYLFFKREMREQFNMFMGNPDIDLCLKIYNMPETAFMQTITSVTLPRIQVNKVVYLPMLKETLTLKNLKETAEDYQDYMKKTQDHTDHEASYEENKEKEEKKTTDQENLVKTSHPASVSKGTSKDDFAKESDESEQSRFLTDPSFYNPEKNVMVRVLSPFELPVDWETREVDLTVIDQANKSGGGHSFFSGIKHTMKKIKKCLINAEGQSFLGCVASSDSPDKEEAKTPAKEYIDVEAIMVHIHGGGFVSMSSSSHQSYTRVYANEVGIPVFSIDYRLAPEYPYPAALNDVWQAYYWLVTNCTTQFGIKPAKIIVTGDSAGGNLACALTMLCIEKHFRVPDFLLPAYPALNLSLLNFAPSLILSLDDYILPTGFLMVFMEAYVKDADAENDHFLSPCICPQNVLEKFPPTRIMTAGNDPLRDEQYRFVVKLVEAGADVRCKEYLYFPHGFLSYNLPVVGIKDCNDCIDQAIGYFEESLGRDPSEYEPVQNSKTLAEGRPDSLEKIS